MSKTAVTELPNNWHAKGRGEEGGGEGRGGKRKEQQQ